MENMPYCNSVPRKGMINSRDTYINNTQNTSARHKVRWKKDTSVYYNDTIVDLDIQHNKIEMMVIHHI